MGALRTIAGLQALAALVVACHAPAPVPDVEPQQSEPAARPLDPAPVREADRILDTGWVLKPHRPGDFGISLRVPVKVTWTQFDLIEGVSLDQLATVAAVPTVELIFPLSEHWTLVPFTGVGGAYQNGDGDLVGGENLLGLSTSGVRATRWQSFSKRYWFGLMGEAYYAAALTGRDGVLGDWGSLDGALELRRDFGDTGSGPRPQIGVYLQGYYYWDKLELDIAGIEPASLESNAEVGISLGTTSPMRILGFKVPRVFVGAILGDLLSGVRIRFGRL